MKYGGSAFTDSVQRKTWMEMKRDSKKAIFDLFSEREREREACSSNASLMFTYGLIATEKLQSVFLNVYYGVRYKFHPDKQERAERSLLNQPFLYSFAIIACMQICANLFVMM